LNTVSLVSPECAPAKHERSVSQYNYSIGYLRAFLIAMVVAFHSALAYHPFAPPLPASMAAVPAWWQVIPVVDTQRGMWAAILTGVNDIFRMALLFFISGLFVSRAVKRKGAVRFLRSRLLRLGIPFLVAVALAPLGYYPAYLQMAGHAGPRSYIRQWLRLSNWPAGPAWFLWVLLAFDSIAVILFLVSPNWAEELGRFISRAIRYPARYFAVLAAISALLYVPLVVVLDSMRWINYGPFAFQPTRILYYLAYFLIGISVGAWGLERGLIASDGKLAQSWYVWVLTALVVLAVSAAGTMMALRDGQVVTRSWEVSMLSAGSCAATCFALLALFTRFVRSRFRVTDSLSANSYGIYLFHYGFVIWLQYALLGFHLSAIAKFGLVFIGALSLSWGSAIQLRRIPIVARII